MGWHMLCPQISMLGFPMPSEVHLPLESASAQVAGEGLEAGVLPGVGDEVRALAERFAAHLAFVGFLTCGQNSLVSFTEKYLHNKFCSVLGYVLSKNVHLQNML